MSLINMGINQLIYNFTNFKIVYTKIIILHFISFGNSYNKQIDINFIGHVWSWMFEIVLANALSNKCLHYGSNFYSNIVCVRSNVVINGVILMISLFFMFSTIEGLIKLYFEYYGSLQFLQKNMFVLIFISLKI